MERNFIRADALMETEFLTEPGKLMHYHEHTELLYMMSGEMDVRIEERCLHLREGDMAVVNANLRHACDPKGEVLICRLLISGYRVMQLTGRNPTLFWLNPEERNSHYSETSRTIRKIIDAVVKNEHRRSGNHIYLDSLYYLLLHELVSYYLVDTASPEGGQAEAPEERIASIFAYIRLNYRDSITLNDLAEHLYLSTTYVSKYISRKCGMSFTELLNSVRLAHAMEDLIYTDNYVMKIAMDNGFSSVAAFNKVFKEAHGVTPSVFRDQLKERDGDNSAEADEQAAVRAKVEEYVEQHPVSEDGKEDLIVLRSEADAKQGALFEWKNNRSMITHVGGAANLLRSAFQEQLLLMKDRIGIRYVCFWGIFSPEMFVSVHGKEGRTSFRTLDVVLDFLLRNDMKPYMELSFKSERILKNVKEALREGKGQDDFSSPEEMENFFRGMMRHFVNRYGEDEVGTWLFDYQETEHLHFEEEMFSFSPMTDDEHMEYFRRFSIISRAFRSVTEKFRLGGGEFPLQHYGEDGFSHLLEMWSHEPEKPSFVTITSFPYELRKDGKKYQEKRASDSEFVSKNTVIAENCMKKAGFGDLDLHVMEYGMSLSNRNIINDSCAKGAFVVKTVLETLEKALMLGSFMFTDVYADYYDVYGILFGGCGLITVNGIPKPALFAYEFLNQLYPEVIKYDRDYIVTSNGRGAFRILCHNFRELNYNYYLKEEDEISLKELDSLIDDTRKAVLKVRISNVRNGVYQIKKQRVNRRYGSIQDEWIELNMYPDLSKAEHEYMRNMSTPHLAIADLIVKEGEIKLETELEPQEIQMISVVLQ